MESKIKTASPDAKCTMKYIYLNPGDHPQIGDEYYISPREWTRIEENNWPPVTHSEASLFRRPAFRRPHDSDCCSSTTIAGEISFGTGELDDYGFWQFPCRLCAEAYELQTNKVAWPHAPKKDKP
jgi:hypothetical protein